MTGSESKRLWLACSILVGIGLVVWGMRCGTEDDIKKPSGSRSDAKALEPRRDAMRVQPESAMDETTSIAPESLENRFVIRGVVLDSDGSPVEIEFSGELRDGDGMVVAEKTIRSNQAGAFLWSLAKPLAKAERASHVIFFRAATKDQSVAGEWATRDADERDGTWELVVALRLEVRFGISGRLIDVDRKGLGGVRVLAFSQGQSGGAIGVATSQTRTRPSGHFFLETARVGDTEVIALPDDRAPAHRRIFVEADRSHDVGDLMSRDGHVLSGRITCFGAPLARLPVSASALGFGLGYRVAKDLIRVDEQKAVVWRRTVETDSEGRFRIAGLSPETYRLAAGILSGPFQTDPDSSLRAIRAFEDAPRVELQGIEEVYLRHALTSSEILRVTPPQEELAFALDLTILELTVRGPNGPIPEARLRFRSLWEVETPATDDRGVLKIFARPGELGVDVFAAGYEDGSATIMIPDGERRHSREIVLKTPEGAILRFHLVDSDGSQISEAIFDFAFEVDGVTKTKRCESTAQTGRHIHHGIPAGRVRIRASLRDAGDPRIHAMESIAVPASGTRDYTLRFVRGGHLKFGIRQTGQFVTGRARILNERGDVLLILYEWSDREGVLRTGFAEHLELGPSLNRTITAFAPGVYTIEFSGGEGSTAPIFRTFTIDSGKTTTLILDR